MNRRNVLKNLMSLGALSAFPATAAFAKIDRPLGVATENVEPSTTPDAPRTGVIAVGGVGGTILSELYGKLSGLHRLIAIDIDFGDLHRVKADHKIWIDTSFATALSPPTEALIGEAIAGLDLAFIVTGPGGVAGASLSAQVAEVLRERQIPTFAAAIAPSGFAGPRCNEVARNGLQMLHQWTIAAFPIFLQPRAAPAVEQLVRGVSSQLRGSGFVCLDLDDFGQVMTGAGYAAIGYGGARGKNAATTATLQAIDHPLLGLARLSTASGVLVLVETSGASFHMQDATKVYVPVQNVLAEFFDGPLRFGAVRTASMTDDFRVTILAGVMGVTGKS